MPSHSRFLLPVTSALLVASFAGCRRPAADASAPAPSATIERLRANLALVPVEARLIFSLDLDRLRASPLGAQLVAAPVRALEHLFAGLAEGAGLELGAEARRLLVALPGERQNDDRLLVILEASPLDRGRASAWLASRQSATAAGFVAGDGRVVMARGAWAAERTRRGPSGELPENAAGDEELRRLCERAAGQSAFWFATIVPTSLRRRLIAEDRFPDVGSITRGYGWLTVDGPLQAEVAAELSNEPDARLLAHRLSGFLGAAKRHPDLLAQGLSPYLDAVHVAARGPGVYAAFELPTAEADDLVARVDELLRSATGGLGLSGKP